MKILVSGGGTSGHISPALALVQTLRELEPNAEFLYVGSKNGLEESLTQTQDIPFVAIETGKLRRYLSYANIVDQFRLPVGVFQSLRILRDFRPDVVLATGGYVAVPPVVAAAILKIPILTHEQTTQIGLANQINARFATKIALSWESALRALPRKYRRKAWVTGNPLRPSIFGGKAEEARAHFGLSDEPLPVVYLTGGSLGARVLNRAVEESLREIVSHAHLIHQCGAQENDPAPDFERLMRARLLLPPELQARYAVTKFIGSELKDVFALADLVIGRAGAGTVTELCALGKPALYVPLVPTGGDEQTKNATMAQNAGAARVLKQADCNGRTLLAEIEKLLSDRPELRNMGARAKTLAKPAAAREIARSVLELGSKNRSCQD